MAGLAGFHLSKRRPLPGNEKLWQARLLRPTARTTEALTKGLHRQQGCGAGRQGGRWGSIPPQPELQAGSIAEWLPAVEVNPGVSTSDRARY